MFNIGFAGRTPEHCNQVKPTRSVRRATLVNKIASRVLQASPLRGMDGLLDRLYHIARSSLDLYKDQGIAIAADQIDFAGGTPIVARKDAEPLFLEMPGCGSLAAATETVGWVTPPLQPVQPTEFLSYGREAHEPYAPFQSAYADSTT